MKKNSDNGLFMTSAERKALQRERDRIKLQKNQLHELTLEALLVATSKAVKERKSQELEKLLAELHKRSGDKLDAPNDEILTAEPKSFAFKTPEKSNVVDEVSKSVDSVQAQKRTEFEAGFIAEKMRLMGESGLNAEKAIRAVHLKRSNHDYDSLEAHMAWWAWQAASSIVVK